MFANIKNGQMARLGYICQPRKKICERYLKILWNEGFISGYSVSNIDANMLIIFLKYVNGRPCISSLQVLSRPGHRIYYTLKQIWKIDSTRSFIVFSTTQGLLTIVECKQRGVGGEPVIVIR